MEIKRLIVLSVSLLCSAITWANTNSPEIVVKSNENPESILAYWTPERMRDATPMELPKTNPAQNRKISFEEFSNLYKKENSQVVLGAPPTIQVTPNKQPMFTPLTNKNLQSKISLNNSVRINPFNTGTLNEQFSSQRLLPLEADLLYPYSTVGKLFFSTPTGDKTCTAYVVGYRVLMTAAHCVNSGSSTGWYTNHVFVPAYRDGVAPFGKWIPYNKGVRIEWMSTGGAIPNASDWGVFAINDLVINGSAKTLGSVVGKLGFKLGATLPNHAHILGYSGNLDGGEKIHQVTSQSAVAVVPNNVEYGSNLSLGAGGGPWIQNFGPAANGETTGTNQDRNLVIGVTSYGYNDNVSLGNGSSVLNADYKTLYDYMCASEPGNC